MITKLNCIIIDDDPDISAIVSDFVSETPFLHLVSTYNNPAEAIDILSHSDINLIILDINLPGIDGMTFAKTLYERSRRAMPRIIFISGSGDHALDGYKVDAIDYLLKPFTYESFFKAAVKAKMHTSSLGQKNDADDHIFIKVKDELIRVSLNEILYVESLKDYIKVFTKDGEMTIALSTMKAMEERLPQDCFMRIHRSFIVALDKIDAIQHYTVKIGKTTIPVTEQYRQQFKEHFKLWV
ncbi:LytR/AlgR family response regulator transcription factor [Mucilaginibacter sp.]|jgi:DNA-binding LytR/AlgR family response regulator|uniref:LytR/AlgR family response regulator transcription factor n=1 Tax=Mucilaginibacter sp. TaxID=1882438 RepID=UPI0035621C72